MKYRSNEKYQFLVLNFDEGEEESPGEIIINMFNGWPDMITALKQFSLDLLISFIENEHYTSIKCLCLNSQNGKYCSDCGKLIKYDFNYCDFIEYIRTMWKFPLVEFPDSGNFEWELSSVKDILTHDSTCLIIDCRAELAIMTALTEIDYSKIESNDLITDDIIESLKDIEHDFKLNELQVLER